MTRTEWLKIYRESCLLLKQNGFDPIPLWDKVSPRKGWPKMPNDAASILTWEGAAIGVRFYRSDLFVIDMDIHVEAVRDAILAMIKKRWPKFAAECVQRHSGGVTLALMGRCVTAKGTKKTARFIWSGTDPKGDLVEIFTGNSKRYLGVLGLHSRGRAYDYNGCSVLDTPVDTLPWFIDSDIDALREGCEEIMREHGWEKVIPVIGPEAAGTKVYDLLPGQVFTLSDGEKVPLSDLERDYEGYVIVAARNGGSGKITGYADLWDPATGHREHSNTRVIVTIGSEGLCLYDTKSEVRHRWKDRAPKPDRDLGEQFTALMKVLSCQ